MKYTIRHLENKYYELIKPLAVVFHTDLGTYESTYNWLKQIDASYHIYIRREVDEIVEFVPLNKGAWHAGRYNQPNERVKEIFKGKNPNKYSIGICYENGGREPAPPTDRQIELATEFILLNNLDRLPLVAHREIAIDKPKEVYDMRDGVREMLGDCLRRVPTKRLLLEVIKRLYGVDNSNNNSPYTGS